MGATCSLRAKVAPEFPNRHFFESGRGDWVEEATMESLFKLCLQSTLHKLEKAIVVYIMDVLELMEIIDQVVQSLLGPSWCC